MLFDLAVPEPWDEPPSNPKITEAEKVALIIAGSFVLAIILGIIMACYQDSDRPKLIQDSN